MLMINMLLLVIDKASGVMPRVEMKDGDGSVNGGRYITLGIPP